MTRRCTECRASFQARGDWQRLCWRCWRTQEDRRLAEQGYKRGFQDGYADALRSAPRQPPTSLDANLARELVRLCHPDRHPPERFEQPTGLPRSCSPYSGPATDGRPDPSDILARRCLAGEASGSVGL